MYFFSLSSLEPVSLPDAADSSQDFDNADFGTVADTITFPDVSYSLIISAF